MLTAMAIVLFGGAFSVAGYAIAGTVLPQMDKITAALRGNVPPARFEPLAALVKAERRIAIRRWSAASAPVPRSSIRREAA